MPEPTLLLRAAITLDGKLDNSSPPETVRGTQINRLDPGELRALLTGGQVDEIHLTIHPRVDGRRDALTLSGPPTPEFFSRSLACRLLGMETRDGECVLRYRVLRRGRRAARTA